MKNNGWNNTCHCGRGSFGILLGFPLVVAILRVFLEHWFSWFIADLSVVVALIIVSILLFWKRKKHTRQQPDAPMTQGEKQHERREEHKLFCLAMASCAVVLLTGTFIGFFILFSATPPGYPVILYGVFRFFGAVIGIVLLVLTFACFEQTKFEFLRLKGAKPSATVSVSSKAALCALVIVLAIAFAIVRLARL